mmetsp:Transcript_113148/g.316191  ORF Transcript_113148/g.316191 Transcript_113148/m.316191 type:complete len:206 (-) Transcript_113148:48-665(-)
MRCQLCEDLRPRREGGAAYLMDAGSVVAAAHRDGIAHGGKLLLVEKAVHLHSAGLFQDVQLLADIDAEHHQREELEHLRFSWRIGKGQERSLVQDAEVLARPGAEGILRVKPLYGEALVRAAVPARAHLLALRAQVVPPDRLERDLVTIHAGGEKVVAILGDLVRGDDRALGRDEHVERQHRRSQGDDPVNGDLAAPAHLQHCSG